MMIIFLHLHKCGGTTIVNAAKNSGLRLPEKHANGNLLDADGKILKYRKMSRVQMNGLIDKQFGNGVQFFAMEFDFPRIEIFFDRLENVQFITCIRDPLERAVSNFNMDIFMAYGNGKEYGFSTYMDQSAPYRSNNYYVKLLCNLDPTSEVHRDHLDYSDRVLSTFFKVNVLGEEPLHKTFEGMGFDDNHFGHHQASREKKRYHRYKSSLDVVGIDKFDDLEFISNNAIDYALFHRVKRRMRKQ